MNRIIIKNGCLLLLILVSMAGLPGCTKFLDQKPKISQVVPHTLADLQSLLDNTYLTNSQSAAAKAEIVADNYIISDANWQSYNSSAGNHSIAQNYIWSGDANSIDTYWDGPYTQVVYPANIV